jgi:GR25 family glycosyltransferase involved in LPS biosynthesis
MDQHIIVISIDQNKADHMRAHLAATAPGWMVHVLPEPALAKDMDMGSALPGYVFTRGEVACFHSHFRAWCLASERFDSAAAVVIMEDDAHLSTGSMKAMQRAWESLDAPDILFMGLNPLLFQTKPHNADTDRITGVSWGAFAYRASTAFYRRAACHGSPTVRVPLDVFLTGHRRLDRVFVQTRAAVIHKKSGASTTCTGLNQ